MVEATAKLGMEIDTTGVVQAVNDLDQMTASAGKAESGTKLLAKAMSSAGKVFAKAVYGMTQSVEALVFSQANADEATKMMARSATAFAAGVYKAAEAEDFFSEKINRATKAIQDQKKLLKSAQNAKTKELSRFYTGNIVAQFQDIAVTAAMGMNPLTIAIQQGTQLSAILETMKNPLEGLKSGFKALISPISLVTVGLTSLAVVGIQMIDWSSAGQKALFLLADSLDFVADNVNVLSAALGILALSTLPSLTTLLTTITPKLIAFGVALKNVAIAVAAFSFKAFVGFLTPLAGTLGIVTLCFLALGAAIVKLKTNLSVLQSVLFVVQKSFNGLIQSIASASAATFGFINLFRGGKFKDISEAVGEILNTDYIEKFGEKLHDAAKSLREYNKEVEEVKNPWESVNKYFNSTLRNIQLETSLIGKETQEVERLRFAFELRNRAIESGLDVTQKDVAKKLQKQTRLLTEAKMAFLTKQESATYDDFVATTERSIQALKDQQVQLFYSGEELYKMQAREDLINKATEKGITLTDTRLETIDRLSNGIAEQRANYDKLNYTLNTATTLTSGFFTDMKNGLQQGQSAWEAFGNAVTRVIDGIADALIQLASNRLVMSVAGNWLMPGEDLGGVATIGSGGGVTGTATIGSGGGVTGTATIGSSGAFFGTTITPHAKGGVFTNNVIDSPTVFKFAKGSRFGVMGEAGPEAVMPLTRSSDGSLGVRAVNNNSEGSITVNVINNTNVRARTEERQTTHGREIDVIIDQMVSQKINDQGSSTNRALTAYSQQKLVSR